LSLYPHQTTGVAWLRERKVGILADEQGLGKTITALVAARGLSRVLVVVPTVVLWNWEAEAVAWLDSPVVQVVDNGRVEIDPLVDIVVVTHGLLLKPWILSQLIAGRWDALIVDEAHGFKSPGAQRTVALYGALAGCADRVWLLTGTPCPNNSGELYTHLLGLAPERLQVDAGGRTLTEHQFVDRFCYWRETPYGRKVTGNRKDMLPELKERIGGFILRRLKKDVLPDLPSIRFETVHLRPLHLGKALEVLQAELKGKVLEAIRDLDDPSSFFAAVKDGEGFARFRRLCGMAKAQPVSDLLYQELADGGLEKVVVFAHHRAVVEKIAGNLMRFGVRTITGAANAELRTENVREFQTNPRVRVMVANIVAGGVGVTLTAAADVVFAEQSWTPGENAQAADRCHRIGQTRRVRVRFMALAGTIDEDITASNRQKIRMIREVLGE